MNFKDKDDFKFYGFGTGGPYNKWLVSIHALSNSTQKGLNTPIPLELRVAISEIHLLGFSLVSDDGWDDNYLRKLAEVKKAIGYDEYLKNLKK
ncbi:hypothetical protein OAU93_00115 [bacterium]|nr:hypothetical protein [bacterium]